MSIARPFAALALLASTLLVPATGHAATMVGTNFGLSVLMPPDGGDDLIAIAAPGQAGTLVPGLIPGLRIGASGGHHEGYLDLAISLLSASGTTITNVTATANYQANFSPASIASPYLTAGFGVVHVSYESESETTPIVGGGVGLRRTLSNGHGGVRFEVRADHFFESDQGLIEGTAIGFKLGFDLYLN
jgi:hypothetical protein